MKKDIVLEKNIKSKEVTGISALLRENTRREDV